LGNRVPAYVYPRDADLCSKRLLKLICIAMTSYGFSYFQEIQHKVNITNFDPKERSNGQLDGTHTLRDTHTKFF